MWCDVAMFRNKQPKVNLPTWSVGFSSRIPQNRKCEARNTVDLWHLWNCSSRELGVWGSCDEAKTPERIMRQQITLCLADHFSTHIKCYGRGQVGTSNCARKTWLILHLIVLTVKILQKCMKQFSSELFWSQDFFFAIFASTNNSFYCKNGLLSKSGVYFLNERNRVDAVVIIVFSKKSRGFKLFCYWILCGWFPLWRPRSEANLPSKSEATNLSKKVLYNTCESYLFFSIIFCIQQPIPTKEYCTRNEIVNLLVGNSVTFPRQHYWKQVKIFMLLWTVFYFIFTLLTTHLGGRLFSLWQHTCSIQNWNSATNLSILKIKNSVLKHIILDQSFFLCRLISDSNWVVSILSSLLTNCK